MRAYQFLTEARVKSSWIARLDYEEEDNIVVMTLLSNAQYEIENVPVVVFNAWIRARSKGKFWHRRIRGKYSVYRVD